MAFPKFEVVVFSKPNFFDAFSSDKCSALELGENKPASYLYRYLCDLQTRTIVIEYEYTDGDYLEDFASYYVRCFQSYERRCKRLHFFGEALDLKEFQELVLRTLPCDRAELIKGSYLGFSVVRPLPSAVVGRTLLATYPDDGGRRHYAVVRKYSANLFGVSLHVQSLPYQEQDTVLAACATVALWSALQKTTELFGTQAPRPAEITRMANGAPNPSGRAIPSHGLTLNQMIHAIRNCGLEPEVFAVSPALPLVSIIYAHLKWGIPVVLVVEVESTGSHAITLAGYSLMSGRVIQQEVAPGHLTVPYVGLRINEFYGHDDQMGPFSRLLVKQSAPANPIVFEGEWKDASTGRALELKPKFLLVPVYNKIRVTCADVQQWIARLWTIMTIIMIVDVSDFEWDLHLTTTNDLKERLAIDPSTLQRKSELIFRQHPRFIWSASLAYKGCKLFEMLADATDMERSMPFYDMIFYDDDYRKALDAGLSAQPLRPLLEQGLTVRFVDFLTAKAKLS